MNLYNELDPYPCQWLRNLIDAGHIADGTVDERSIRDITAADVRNAVQFHAFAGIGVWSYALRLAGWPDYAPVWTGSCPCQPFSTAGKGRGVDDERHLWPVWRDLIAECRPPVIFGEQVASPAGRDWFSAVRADLEKLGYEVGAADLCAAGVGAPHIRQRLFFGARLADAHGVTRDQRGADVGGWDPGGNAIERARSCGDGDAIGLADADGTRSQGRGPVEHGDRQPPRAYGMAGRLADTASERLEGGGVQLRRRQPEQQVPPSSWSGADYLECSDGKARPTQPGLHPLADGTSSRVGRLRAYGNAIVPQVAAQFVRAFMETSQ